MAKAADVEAGRKRGEWGRGAEVENTGQSIQMRPMSSRKPRNTDGERKEGKKKRKKVERETDEEKKYKQR